MLTGSKIHESVLEGTITISPFDPNQCGPNSYDVRVGEGFSTIKTNDSRGELWFAFPYGGGTVSTQAIVNTGKPSETGAMEIVERNGVRGHILLPNRAYLAHTIEIIGSDHYVPVYHGRSSTARHGLMTHYAGLGDLGWRGQLVLELVNMTGYPMFLPIGVRVGQVSFHRPEGVINLYNSTYQNQTGIVPAKALT